MCLGTTGVITAIHDDGGIPMALVSSGQAAPVPACLLTCPDAAVGQTVLIHSGYVLKIVDAAEDWS